jgi:hypothetical protein
MKIAYFRFKKKDFGVSILIAWNKNITRLKKLRFIRKPPNPTIRRDPIFLPKRTPGSLLVQHPQYIPANPT